MLAYWASVLLGYFYLLHNSTPETKEKSGPGRETNCDDVYGLGMTEPLPETHIGP